jgi:V-type H+-transporting ATPase subunit G
MGDLDARCLARLKSAEEEAAAVIAAARARKTTRLKQVRAEAEVEVATYRQHRETTFQLFAGECTGISSTHQRSVARFTEEELASVALKVSANKQAMIDSLLQTVTTVAAPVTVELTETSPEPSPVKSPSHPTRPTSAPDPVRSMAPLPRTAVGLLEDDTGRSLLVRDRFAEADDDNSGTLDTDECVTLIGTL